MIKSRKQNSTTYPQAFFMADSSDHVTGKVGLSPTVTLSKNGGAFAAAAGAVTEIGNGWYSLAGNATDRNTLGEQLLHAEASGADDFDGQYSIVDFDPFVFKPPVTLAAADVSGNVPAEVKAQDNIDFGALQKASITAAVPDVSAIQSGLALDATVAKAATALSTAVWTDAKAAFLDVAVSSLGTGITSFPAQTYTITSDGLPCADCLVVMTTDLAGSNSIHSGTTNALGQVTFYPDLPAGTTVYLWRFKTGVNFVNPDTEVTA